MIPKVITPDDRIKPPSGYLECKIYVGKGCFAGYRTKFSLSYTYHGPASFIVSHPIRIVEQWTELATLYQNEGLGPEGDPFDPPNGPSPFVNCVYRFRLRDITVYEYDVVVFAHLVTFAPSEKGNVYMFSFTDESHRAGGGASVHVIVPRWMK